MRDKMKWPHVCPLSPHPHSQSLISASLSHVNSNEDIREKGMMILLPFSPRPPPFPPSHTTQHLKAVSAPQHRQTDGTWMKQ